MSLEFGRGVTPTKVWSQLTKFSGNSDIHQHVVHNNSVSYKKENFKEVIGQLSTLFWKKCDHFQGLVITDKVFRKL